MTLISQDNLTIEGKTGKGNISFSSNRPWKVSSSAEWCKVSPSWGDGNVERVHDLFVVCEDNDGKDSRECIITIESGDKTITIPLVQDHIDGICLDVVDYSVGVDACEVVVELWKSVQEISIDIPENSKWISVSRTKAMVPGEIVFDIKENMGAARTGTVTISGGEKSGVITIKQAPSSLDFPDEVFRDYCLRTFDKDRNGLVSKQEALNALALEVSYNVEDLTGVEYFQNITNLSLYSQTCTSFDFGQFQQLKRLELLSPVDTVILDVCPKLNMVSTSGKHKYFGTKSSPNLEVLDLYARIDTLDLSGCPRLKHFFTSSQSRNLNVSNIQGSFSLIITGVVDTLVADGSGIKEITINPNSSKGPLVRRLFVRNCPNIKTIWGMAWSEGLEEIICTGNPALESFTFSGARSLSKATFSDCKTMKSLYLQHSALTDLVLNNLPALNNLSINNCGFQSTLDLTGVPSVNNLTCLYNPDLQTIYCKTIPEAYKIDDWVTIVVVD